MIVHVFRFVFSSTPTSDLTSQKPESLKCEHTVEPPATAATTHARYSGGSSDIPGIAAMIPAAMVIATVAEPTQIRTSAATIKATSTIGKLADETAFPIKSPSPEYCNTYLDSIVLQSFFPLDFAGYQVALDWH